MQKEILGISLDINLSALSILNLLKVRDESFHGKDFRGQYGFGKQNLVVVSTKKHFLKLGTAKRGREIHRPVYWPM